MHFGVERPGYLLAVYHFSKLKIKVITLQLTAKHYAAQVFYVFIRLS